MSPVWSLARFGSPAWMILCVAMQGTGVQAQQRGGTVQTGGKRTPQPERRKPNRRWRVGSTQLAPTKGRYNRLAPLPFVAPCQLASSGIQLY